MDKNNQLETAPIGKLVFKLAIPTVMAQLVNLLYNIGCYVSYNLACFGICNACRYGRCVKSGGKHGRKRQRQSRENTRQLYNAAYNIFGSAGGCVYAYEKSDIDEIRRK